MLCEKCGIKPATIHTTDVVNDVKTEKRLCESCYDQEGLSEPLSALTIESHSPSSLKIDLTALKDFLGSPRTPGSARDVTCPRCGLTLEEFKRRKAVGCAHDYEVFAEEFERMLHKLHGARRHTGKFPKSVEAQRAREHQIELLKKDLSRSVGDEDYEEAARLRDRIRALEEGRGAGHDPR